MADARNRVCLTDVTEALEILLTPALRSCGYEAEQVKDPFLNVLQQNLNDLKMKLSSEHFYTLSAALEEKQADLTCGVCTNAVEWQFISTILQLLNVLASVLRSTASVSGETSSETNSSSVKSKPKRPQDAPPLPDSALSMAQISTVKNALQFVASLGICPNLNPGVGIPVQHRSKILKLAPVDITTLAEISESSESKRSRLAVCITAFAEFLKTPELHLLITGAHLNDTLAALLQLLHAYPERSKSSASHCRGSKQADYVQDVKLSALENENNTAEQQNQRSSMFGTVKSEGTLKSNEGEENSVDEKKVYEVNSETQLALENVKFYRQVLESLLSSVSHDLVIRELMVLQSGVPRPAQNARNPDMAVSSPPAWLRKACSQLLLRLVRGPEGILHLYSALSAGSDPNSPSHWKQCGVVAKIIAGCPVPVQEVDHYVSSVSQQLKSLLHKSRRDTGDFTHLVGAVVSAMHNKYQGQLHRHFIQPLLNPLYKCLDSNCQGMEHGTVVVSEEELTACLENMRSVCVRGQQPQASIVSVLQPVIGVLWTLFCFTRAAVYSVKNCVRELLTSYMKFLGCDKAAECLRCLCVSDAQLAGETGDDQSSVLTVHFEAGSKGGLQAVYVSGEREMKLSDTQQVEAVIDVLHDLKKDGVAGELLVTLLKELTEIISVETQQPDIVLPSNLVSSKVREKKQVELMKRVTLLHLLASICETFGSECLSNNTQILFFAKASLERGVAVCKGTTEEEMAVFETETMSMAMGLLTAVMAGAIQMEEKHRLLLDEMLPLLEVIGQGHPDEFIQEMASDIRITIATRGAVWSSLQKTRPEERNEGAKMNPSLNSKHKPKTQSRFAAKPLIEVLSEQDTASKDPHKQPSTAKPKPLIEVLPDNSAAHQISERSSQGAQAAPESRDSNYDHACLHTDGGSVSGVDSLKISEDVEVENTSHGPPSVSCKPSEKSALQTVFEELCDPLLPVRGHALIALAKLVEERDAETLSKKDIVQKIFEENIRHGDSYLYLAAIRGLGALSDCFSESVVPSLAAEFAGFSQKSVAGLTAEHKLKVGEALMKATRNLGKTIPKYRELLLGAVLTGARDKDATVRASSLSNLAELCSLLHFSLGSVLQEVFSCCKSLLETDEAIVRRAAALTLAKILEGLDKDALVVLDLVLKDLYRLLKRVHNSDSDDAVRLHANMALVQLDAVSRLFLFPPQTLQKKIQILSNEETFR